MKDCTRAIFSANFNYLFFVLLRYFAGGGAGMRRVREKNPRAVFFQQQEGLLQQSVSGTGIAALRDLR